MRFLPHMISMPNLEQALHYQIDRWQRSVLFLDMLRERGFCRINLTMASKFRGELFPAHAGWSCPASA